MDFTDPIDDQYEYCGLINTNMLSPGISIMPMTFKFYFPAISRGLLKEPELTIVMEKRQLKKFNGIKLDGKSVFELSTEVKYFCGIKLSEETKASGSLPSIVHMCDKEGITARVNTEWDLLQKNKSDNNTSL